MKKSIFRKATDDSQNQLINGNQPSTNESYNQHTVLDRNDLLSTIPDEATEVEREPQQNEVAWRWRFFNINDRRMIEISYIEPGKSRVYLDYAGNKTQFNIHSSWDQYVTRTLYYYAPIYSA